MRPGLLSSPQQLMNAERSLCSGTVLLLDAMLAALLADMFAHELAGFGIEDANE